MARSVEFSKIIIASDDAWRFLDLILLERLKRGAKVLQVPEPAAK